MRAVWVCVCGAALLACTRETAPLGSSEKPRGAGRAAVPTAPSDTAEVPETQAPARTPLPDWAKTPSATRDAGVGAARTSDDGGADSGPKRDLSAELKGAVGSPASCIKPRLATEDLPRDITITVSAMVMESGTLGRTTVTAPGLEADEITCIKGMLEHARIPGSVPDAPRDVSAEVHLVRAAPTTPQAPASE